MDARGFVREQCPKCGGNVYLEKDNFGWYQQCLQCGFIQNLGKYVEVSLKNVKKSLKETAHLASF